ncbi:MAG: DNA-processing protein DprA [bacterium]|nr:DNA-processing protein DprA [bacterium]
MKSNDQVRLFPQNHLPAAALRDDPLGTLTLFKVPGVGSVRFRILIGLLGSPAEVFKASETALKNVPGIDSHTAAAIRSASINGTAEKVLRELGDCGARYVSIWDEEYPAQLKEIHDPPALLFVRGSLPAQEEACVAIVGTRDPSLYGIQQSHRIAEELARQGIGVVSGMARGVDTSAHEGCLQGEGRTYAVFGCGIDTIYPTENKSIAKKIETTGGLISEFLPGTQPDPGLFPRRNRLISGLSLGVLVIQGDIKSGALITARCALEHNREVFALPGSVEDRRSRGPHSLIREGATLITSSQDVVEAIGMQFRSTDERGIPRPMPVLNASEQQLVVKLSFDPIHIDQLVRNLGLPVQSVLADLLGLEMKGIISQLPGKLFQLRRV